MSEPNRSHAGQAGRLMGRLVSHPVLTALVVLVIGLAASYSLYGTVTRLERSRLRDNFRMVALKHRSLLERTIHSSILPLETLHSFYRSSDSVYRDEFRSFVQPLLAHHREIQTLQWIPCVRPDQAPVYERTARQEGISGFRISAWQGNNSETADRDDGFRFPIYVVEPHDEYAGLLGIDLASHPKLAEALDWACDQDAVAATQTISFDDRTGAAGVMFVLKPVYRSEEPKTASGERRDNLVGFVAATYRADSIVSQTLTPQDRNQFILAVYDMMAPTESQLFYQSKDLDGTRLLRFDPNEEVGADEIVHCAVLNLADRLWGARYLPSESFLRSQSTGKAPIVFAACAVLALLLALGAVVGLRHSARIREVSVRLRAAMDQLEQDVRERRKAEDALRSSEALYRSTIDAMSDFILVIDKGLKITLVNRMLVDRFHETGLPTDFVGKLLTEAFPFVSEKTVEEYHRIFETGETQTVTECYPLAGTPFTIDIQRIPVLEDGQVVRIITAARDVTERKKVEHDLRLTRFAVDKAADAVYWMGRDARFVYVNDAACRALGYTKDELLTMTVHDIDPNFPPEVWPKHWDDLRKFRSFTIQSDHRAKNGRTFPVEISVNLVEFEGHEYNCAHARDMSEQRRVRKSEETSICSFQNFADNTVYGVAVISPRMKLLYMNRRLKDWYPDADLTKAPTCHDLFNSSAPGERCAHCPGGMTLEDGGTHQAVERRMVGETLHILKVTTSPIRDKDNKIIAIVETVEQHTGQPIEIGGEETTPKGKLLGSEASST